MPKYDYATLAAALEGFEAQRARLDDMIAKTKRLLATMEPPADGLIVPPAPPPKPRLSSSGRDNISAAQKARWERERAAKAKTTNTAKKRA